MSLLEQQIAEIEAHATPPRPDPRALDLLRRLAAGDTLRQAATHIGIPYGTATHLLGPACDLLGAVTTTQAVVIADRRGLLKGVR